MEKQTAVEYLFEQLWETPKDKFTWHSILKKAKEMEEQEKEIMFSEQQLIEAIVRASNSKTELILDRCIEIIKTIKDK